MGLPTDSSITDVDIHIMHKLHEFNVTKEQLIKDINKLEKLKKKGSKIYKCIPENTPASIMQQGMKQEVRDLDETENFMKNYYSPR